ncbi:MAG: hypothetical protein LBQ66_09310 [Planctomycetaceae bacterium]|nr:hypothetical protein [Planctomycetaceae bacterium]
MGTRPPGGYVVSESLSLADSGIANTYRQNKKNVDVVGARLALVPKGLETR